MIENEVKFILGNHTALYEKLSRKYEPKTIWQGYLSGNARVRKVKKLDGSVKHFFTYKHTLASGETEEFEQRIDADSYERVKPECKKWLMKYRFNVLDSGNSWDIDFLVDIGSSTAYHCAYICVAECEMETGVEYPEVVLNDIQPHIIYRVPREETSCFSNKKLSCVNYTRKLLEEIKDREW